MRRNKIHFMAIAALLMAAFVCAGTAKASNCGVGDSAQVEWKGKWYPAHVTKVDGDQNYIHYDGYSNSWDEWVGPSRIKGCKAGKEPKAMSKASTNNFPVGAAVQVKWKSSWWPAHVIAVGSNSWKIHYDGYSSSWDEWVGPDRIR